MVAATLAADLAELILPQRCIECGRFGAALHDACIAALDAADGARCDRCWRPLRGASARRCEQCAVSPPAFAGLRAAFRFSGSARRALVEAKFRGVARLLDPLAEAAAAVVPATWPVDAVVPVPLHHARERRRGFNQAVRIAEQVARRLGAPLRADALARVRATPNQVGLDARQRSTNLRDAFVASRPVPRCPLLIDDITTTGATFEAAARALSAAGAQRVYALAVARED